MANLEKFKDRATLSSSIGELIEIIGMITTGTVASGGALTHSILIAKSFKAFSALSDLARILMPKKGESSEPFDPAERVDEIFYVFAQRSYMNALKLLENKLPGDAKVEPETFISKIKDIQNNIIKPDLAQASFQYGWVPESGPIQLFRSYSSWVRAILISMNMEEGRAIELTETIENKAQIDLYKSLVSKKKDQQWMVNYLMLNDVAELKSLMEGYISERSAPSDTAWKNYLKDLILKPKIAIWGEEELEISIEQLFVEPDYTYSWQIRHGQNAPLKLDIHKDFHGGRNLKAFLTGLLTGRRPSTELIFLMGSPGSGKTSLMEILCADIANTGKVHIMLVPAKKIKPEYGLVIGIQKFLKSIGNDVVSETFMQKENCILAIDGFDELAYATRLSLETFFREAQNLVRERLGNQLRIILSGRPTLFSEKDVVIPQGSHIICLKKFNRDRVKKWSMNWRNSSTGSFHGEVYLDEENKNLTEMISTPMLLYLFARMHEDGQPILTKIESGSNNAFTIYKRIIDWICYRQKDKGIETDIEGKLRRYLQVAGLATHQSGSRILHYDFFTKALCQNDLSKDDIDPKVHSIILQGAFVSVKDKAWEFTHKSFGEFLAAESIIKLFKNCFLLEDDKKIDSYQFKHSSILKDWIDIFGPKYISDEIRNFCKGWFQVQEVKYLTILINRFIIIFSLLFEAKESSTISDACKFHDLCMTNILGNALQSWFLVYNAAIESLSKKDSKTLEHFKNRIPAYINRIGIYAATIVNPSFPDDYITEDFRNFPKLIMNSENVKNIYIHPAMITDHILRALVKAGGIDLEVENVNVHDIDPLTIVIMSMVYKKSLVGKFINKSAQKKFVNYYLKNISIIKRLKFTNEITPEVIATDPQIQIASYNRLVLLFILLHALYQIYQNQYDSRISIFSISRPHSDFKEFSAEYSDDRLKSIRIIDEIKGKMSLFLAGIPKSHHHRKGVLSLPLEESSKDFEILRRIVALVVDFTQLYQKNRLDNMRGAKEYIP